MLYPIRYAASVAVCFVLFLFATSAQASLIFADPNQASGTGLGSVQTILTMQRDPTDPDSGTESGCVAWNGSMDITGPAACPPGFAGTGGNEDTAVTETYTIAESGIASAFNLRLVFNFNEQQSSDTADNITLDDLVLTLYNADGSLCFDSGDFDNVGFAQPRSGTGNAGFVFRLDAEQAADAQACFVNPQNRIGLAAQALNAEGGIETFYIANAEDLVAATADLRITKTDSPDPVGTNSTLTYTLLVENLGPNNAEGVMVSDTLPSSVNFQSATPGQGSCSLDGRVVNCDLGFLAAGDQTSIQITVTTGDSEGTINNAAAVRGDPFDPNPGNNTVTEPTQVTDSEPVVNDVDLSVVKNDTPDPVLVGNTLSYQIEVRNAGPEAASDVTVTDSLPASATFSSASTGQGSCSNSGQTVVCELGTLNVGELVIITIEVVPQETGAISNGVVVTSDGDDTNPDNNSDQEQTTVTDVAEAAADLAVTKSDSSDPVAPGASFDYLLEVTNNGPDPAVAAQLTDNLPADVTVNSIPANCSQTASTITCDLGDLAVSEVVNLTFSVTAPGMETTLTNAVSVESDTNDPNLANNSATEQTVVEANPNPAPDAADVSLTKTDAMDPVIVGSTVTYTLTISNGGPDTATAVTVNDNLPDSLSDVTATPSSGSCNVSGDQVTCLLGDMPASTQETVSISGTATEAGTILNTANVTSSTNDPDTGNNSDSEQTDVNETAAPSADVAVSKADSEDPVTLGQTFSYNIVVSNNSTDTAAQDVDVADSVPESFTVQGFSTSQGSCSNTGNQVNCQLGTLSAGQSVSIAIQVTPTVAGTFTNVVSVSSSSPDSDTDNNSDSEDTTVDADDGTGGAAPATPVPAVGLPGLALLILMMLFWGWRRSSVRAR